MKIGLQTWGTDGDFFPFLALAIGLRDAGHQVVLAYTSVDGKDYSDRDDVTGIELIRANGNVTVPEDFNPYAINARPGSFKEYTTLLDRWFEPFTEAMFNASVELCQQCDVVVGHAVCHTLETAGQKFNVPRVSLVLTPIIVRSDHTSPIGVELGTTINAFLWSAGGRVSTAWWFNKAKAIRKQEGLPAIKSLQKEVFTSDMLTLVAASESLCPRPIDWPNMVQITGFLNLPSTDESWQMPEDLKLFLNDGESPVYMTFGSCMQFDLEDSTALMIEAARLSGKRAIIQSDWDQLHKPQDPNIFCIDRTPHAEVFPHCSLIVHHGGAGTTQAALLAGKPSVVVPHGFDQSYWATQLQKAGIAGKAIIRTSATPKRLSSAIHAVLNSPKAFEKASETSREMKLQNGVQKAMSLIVAIPKKSPQQVEASN